MSNFSNFLEGELKRPLLHTARTHWEAEVHPQEFIEGGSTTVFHWVARSNGAGLIGGDIVVMPDRNAILFQERRESEWETYEDPETVLRRVALFQWGEQDHFDKVCASLQAVAAGTSLEDVVQGWRQLAGVVSR